MVSELAALAAGQGLANMSGPKEQAGFKANVLTEFPVEKLKATIGLEGTPCGCARWRSPSVARLPNTAIRIARSIVTVLDDSRIEARLSDKGTFYSEALGEFPKNEDTLRWVYNRNNAPATALVCDRAKAL